MKFLVAPKVSEKFSARCGVQTGKCGRQIGKFFARCGVQVGRL